MYRQIAVAKNGIVRTVKQVVNGQVGRRIELGTRTCLNIPETENTYLQNRGGWDGQFEEDSDRTPKQLRICDCVILMPRAGVDPTEPAGWATLHTNAPEIDDNAIQLPHVSFLLEASPRPRLYCRSYTRVRDPFFPSGSRDV